MPEHETEEFPDQYFRADAISKALEDCSCHSRQTEATLHEVLWPLPKKVIEFVTEKVSIHWKQKNHVAILLANGSKKPFTIILDTKLENESMKVRVGIIALKIAEAYLDANIVIRSTRAELVAQWGIDLDVLNSESICGLTY